MENATTEKEKKDFFDEDNGILFMKNWNPILRWILVLPGAIIGSLLMRTPFTFIATKLEDIEILMWIVDALGQIVAIMAFVGYGAAIAPKGRKVTAIILAVLALAGTSVLWFVDPEKYNITTTYKIVSMVGTLIGAAWGYSLHLKSNTLK